MKKLENQSGNKSTPALRVVCDDEAGESRTAKKLDRQWPPFRLNSKAEEYWAGRFPAARLSTRVAA